LVQYKTGVTFTAVMHAIGSLSAFGLACVYMWMHAILTRVTVRQLSSTFVCWSRLILAFVASVIWIFGILTGIILFQRTKSFDSW